MDEEKYILARRRYKNAHGHHEALQTKQRKTMKQVNRLQTELGQQQTKLQKINEDLVIATEKLKLAKAAYGPFREQWKELHPQGANHDRQPA